MKEKLLTEQQLIDLLLNMKQGVPLRPFAAELGVNFRMLSKVLHGDVSPGVAIPAALGYEPVTLYRKLKTRNNGRRSK